MFKNWLAILSEQKMWGDGQTVLEDWGNGGGGRRSLLFEIQRRQQEGWKINGRIDEDDDFLTLYLPGFRLFAHTFFQYRRFFLCLSLFLYCESLSQHPVDEFFVLPRQASLTFYQSLGRCVCWCFCVCVCLRACILSPSMHAFGQPLSLCTCWRVWECAHVRMVRIQGLKVKRVSTNYMCLSVLPYLSPSSPLALILRPSTWTCFPLVRL